MLEGAGAAYPHLDPDQNDEDLDTDGDGLVDDTVAVGTTTPVYGTDDTGTVVPAGTLVVNSNGDYTFTPNATFTGEVPAAYTISDGNGGTDQATLEITVINTNDAPVITSVAAANAAENQTAVTTVTATDADGDTPSFTITGGADQALFSITAGGVLTFNAAPDFETVADLNSDGVYEVEVTANDGNSGSDVQTILVTVTDVNEAPTDIELDPRTVFQQQQQKNAAGRQQLHGHQIDVFVAAQCAIDVALRVGELGRVKDDRFV